MTFQNISSSPLAPSNISWERICFAATEESEDEVPSKWERVLERRVDPEWMLVSNGEGGRMEAG